MTNYFIIPGLGNSGEEHWQTFFEQSGSNFQRIVQQEWDAPDCNDWINTIDKAIAGYDPSTVVLIGHSLGCATIAHCAPIPIDKINFKTIVVASENDEWVSLERAKFFAATWGSEFISIGNAGHINTASGYGQWKQGLEILKMLR